MKAIYQRGASLIEVMVSVFIVALAFMGMAGLAANALKYSKMASFQSAASYLVEDYAERMRANMEANYEQTEKYQGRQSAVPIPVCATSSNCKKEEIASIDIAEWKNLLINSLPEGGAVIMQDGGNKFVYDIWIFWMDPESNFGQGSLNIGGNCRSDLFNLPSGTPQPNCIYQRVVL